MNMHRTVQVLYRDRQKHGISLPCAIARGLHGTTLETSEPGFTLRQQKQHAAILAAVSLSNERVLCCFILPVDNIGGGSLTGSIWNELMYDVAGFNKPREEENDAERRKKLLTIETGDECRPSRVGSSRGQREHWRELQELLV